MMRAAAIPLIALLLAAPALESGAEERSAPAPASGAAEPAPAAAPPPSEARVLLDAGDYAAAEAKARQRLAEVEAESGPQSLPTALALDEVAEALWRLGRGADPEARDLAARAISIKESLLDPGDPALTTSLRNLAILFNQNGDYPGAKVVFERALRINKAAYGLESRQAAASLDNLATLLRNEGDYVAARPMTETALAIKRRVWPAGSDQIGLTAGNLGATIALMGDYEGARPFLEESLSIQEKAHAPDHPSTLLALDNVAELMILAGDYESARPLEERALRLREAKLGPDHFHVALSLVNMGQIETASGNRDAALEDLQRALAVREKAFGPDHPWVAQSLDELAEAQLQFGDARAARAAFERALRIQEQTLDPRHPNLARTVVGLARALLALGETSAAFQRGLEGERLGREHFQAAAQGLSEADALRYAHTLGGGRDVALTILASGRKGAIAPDATTRLWDQIVRSRALVLDEMASRHRYVSNQTDPEVARRARDLNAARSRLAGLLGKLPPSGSTESYRARVDRAYQQKEAAERALAEASAPYRRQQTRSRAGFADVLNNLPERSALVAFVRYRQQAHWTAKPPVPCYAAFVVSTESRTPVMVPLGKAAEIDALVESWQREIGTDPRHSGTVAAAEERYRAAGEDLRRIVWDPLAPHLGQVGMILVVPDGALNLVNLATLPLAGGRFLLEEAGLLHYLSSERDLIPVDSVTEARPGLLAIGAVDYDSTQAILASAARAGDGASQDTDAGTGFAAGEAASGAAHYRSPATVCSGLSALRFQPLPATGPEVDAIAELAGKGAGDARGPGVRTLVGAAADEATFESEAGRFGILHLATHAFFANDRCDDVTETETVGQAARGGRGSVKPSLQAMQDPLLLTGLALAGANRRGDARGVDGADGLLTSEEIASLDLSGARWAVLSACRTGVGAIRNGEGVLGLRRAFEIAGAGTLIMSLWQVEDEATAAWMKALYLARAGNLPTAESVRRASLDLLSAQRSAGRSTHPFFWGAFIAAGDWR